MAAQREKLSYFFLCEYEGAHGRNEAKKVMSTDICVS